MCILFLIPRRIIPTQVKEGAPTLYAVLLYPLEPDKGFDMGFLIKCI